MDHLRSYLHTKVVQFFCTQPLVAFIGIMLMLQARGQRARNPEAWPPAVTNAITVLGFSAGIIALWVMFAPAPHLNFRKWMGWTLIAYWLARGVGSLAFAAETSDGFWEFTTGIHGFYGWSIIAVLGLLMIVAPNPYHLWDESYAQTQHNKRG